MALKLPSFDKEVERKKITFPAFDEGVYLVSIATFEDKIEEFEGINKDASYYNLNLKMENGKGQFVKIYYQNKEGNSIPTGFNTLAVDLVRIFFEAKEIPTRLKEDFKKRKEVSADDLLAELKKYEVKFWVAFRKTKASNGNEYNNVNNFIPFFYDKESLVDEDAEKPETFEELVARKKLKFIRMEKETSYNKDDDDDDYDDDEVDPEDEDDDY